MGSDLKRQLIYVAAIVVIAFFSLVVANESISSQDIHIGDLSVHEIEEKLQVRKRETSIRESS